MTIDPVEGFYSVYITGKEGQGFALVLFMQGQIIGADAGGFVLDGQYIEDVKDISISLSTKAPPNVPRVQGGLTGPQGEENHLNFRLPQNFTSLDFIRIDTSRGPINIKLIRLRGLK